jgi:ornithine carbamoyltransferase
MRNPDGSPAMPDDYLRVADLEPEALEHLLDLATRMKRAGGTWPVQFRGQALACLFEKPSTSTRISVEVAAHRLGMLPLMLRPDELQPGRGEPIVDTARVLSGYVAAIFMRTFSQQVLEEVAEVADVPVINALSESHHPCQALADLVTLRERFGRLRGLSVAYLGDASNVAHSLMEAAALSGVELRIACPEGYEPSPRVESWARQAGAETETGLLVTRDVGEAVAGADAVYTDAWISMGEEEEARARLQDLAPYAVTAEVMAQAAPDAVFLHCLPPNRGQEVAAEVIDGPRSIAWQQAVNRLHTEQAVLYELVLRSRESSSAVAGETAGGEPAAEGNARALGCA